MKTDKGFKAFYVSKDEIDNCCFDGFPALVKDFPHSRCVNAKATLNFPSKKAIDAFNNLIMKMDDLNRGTSVLDDKIKTLKAVVMQLCCFELNKQTGHHIYVGTMPHNTEKEYYFYHYNMEDEIFLCSVEMKSKIEMKSNGVGCTYYYSWEYNHKLDMELLQRTINNQKK